MKRKNDIQEMLLFINPHYKFLVKTMVGLFGIKKGLENRIFHVRIGPFPSKQPLPFNQPHPSDQPLQPINPTNPINSTHPINPFRLINTSRPKNASCPIIVSHPIHPSLNSDLDTPTQIP